MLVSLSQSLENRIFLGSALGIGLLEGRKGNITGQGRVKSGCFASLTSASASPRGSSGAKIFCQTWPCWIKMSGPVSFPLSQSLLMVYFPLGSSTLSEVALWSQSDIEGASSCSLAADRQDSKHPATSSALTGPGWHSTMSITQAFERAKCRRPGVRKLSLLRRNEA